MGNLLPTNISQSFQNIFSLEWMQKKTARILILGLDDAGKSTILYRWKLGEDVKPVPTIGFNIESIRYKNITMTMQDVGGNTIARRMRRFYYPDTDAIIYVVNSSDIDRLEESSEELHLTLSVENLSKVPVLILANKQDLSSALNCDKITDAMKLRELGHDRWRVMPCVATTGEGLKEAMQWIGEELLSSSSGRGSSSSSIGGGDER